MPGASTAAAVATVVAVRGEGDATDGLARLIAAIDAACDSAASQMPARIVAALQAAADDPDFLSAAQCAANPNHYARHVLHADPAGRYTVLALVWGPGQFSPVHAHHAWCAYAVRGPELTETLFEFDNAAQQAVALHTQTRRAGYGCFAHSGLEQIHRLGNAGVTPALSIHIYGVDAAQVCSHVNRVIEARQ